MKAKAALEMKVKYLYAKAKTELSQNAAMAKAKMAYSQKRKSFKSIVTTNPIASLPPMASVI